jgi:hypothetical protein
MSLFGKIVGPKKNNPKYVTKLIVDTLRIIFNNKKIGQKNDLQIDTLLNFSLVEPQTVGYD